MMHLFEALLAMHDATGEATILDDAAEHLAFMFDRLYDASAGRLPELYTPEWTPLPTSDGGYIDVGHQFEWAYLLSTAVERGLPVSYLDHAAALLDCGLRVGYDPVSGGVYSHASPDGCTVDKTWVWWAQCEAARALLHFALLRGRGDLYDRCERIMSFCLGEMVDDVYGGWYIGAEGAQGRERW